MVFWGQMMLSNWVYLFIFNVYQVMWGICVLLQSLFSVQCWILFYSYF